MGQSRRLTRSVFSATGTSATATPRMTSCSSSWPSQPTSATRSSPLPSPPAMSGPAPSVCFQVWTGAKKTTVSAPPTANQGHQLPWEGHTQVCIAEKRGEDTGWTPGTYHMSNKRPAQKSKAPPFPGCQMPPCLLGLWQLHPQRRHRTSFLSVGSH